MTIEDNVPFLELAISQAELEEELVSIFRSALRTAAFIGGPAVEDFERDFSFFCESQHCVGVSSGTDALRFALMAAGIRPGDSVITVPNTFIATAEAISQAGAQPEFVDVDERTYNMNPGKLREFLEMQCDIDAECGRAISRRTGHRVTAVVPVHLFGQTAEMDPILELAETYRLFVIEDACQAHGAEYFSQKEQRWRRAGSMGKAAAFSFYPSKNLGACGEAGAVTTNDPELAQKVRMLRDHGQIRKYYHEIEGYNGRLDAIQARILQVKLAHLSEWNAKRGERAREYSRLLAAVDGAVILPYEPSWSRAVYHLYAIRSQDRKGLMSHLRTAGIGTAIHYPFPLHLQKAYKSLNHRMGDFPVAEKVAAEIMSLPMYPQLTAAQQARVANEILSFTGTALPQVQRDNVRARTNTESAEKITGRDLPEKSHWGWLSC